MNLPFAATVWSREITASTNDDARLAVLDPTVALPLVIVADRQTRGRGRGSHAWWSDSGSLTMTIALDPLAHGLRVDQEPKLALATAVSLIDGLSAQVPAGLLGIRWPNDVEADGRKLAGILPERVETPVGPRLLIGIGLNVSTRLDEAPEAIRSMATSVDLLRGDGVVSHPRDPLRALLSEFAKIVPLLAIDDPSLADRWASLDTLRDRRVRIVSGDRLVSGIGSGIDARGGLRVATGSGIETFYGGQVLRDV